MDPSDCSVKEIKALPSRGSIPKGEAYFLQKSGIPALAIKKFKTL
jgi:hypothetical protein